MKVSVLSPMLLVAVVLAGCGGGGGGNAAAKLQSGDVAVVAAQHVTLVAYNDALAEERASLKQSGQAVPKAGSTAYSSMQTQVINTLVDEAEFTIAAQKMGIIVTPAEIATQLTALKKKQFGGSDAKYQAALKLQGFTNAEVESSIREQLLEQKIAAAVTKGVKVSATEIQTYYDENLGSYQQAASRKVREILVGKNKETLANQIYGLLKSGQSFAALAKRYSQDPGSKNSGGLFTAHDGSDVPEFDKAVFAASAKTNELLKPVNTAQYGWFVIQPLAPIVAATTESVVKAAPSIRSTLLSSKDQSVLGAWIDKVEKSYCGGGQVSYQTGYSPSPDPCASLTAPNSTTT
jgi:parvulin-like peptidyl-prolyl isomerase